MAFLGRLTAFMPLAGLVLFAPAPGKPETLPADPGLYEVRLADGSVLKMHLLTEEIQIVTRYGKLQVPMADVRRIEVGFRYPTGVEQRVEKAVERLGDADFKVREAAQAELLGFKELAYPALKRVGKSDDQEVKRRVADLMRQLEEKMPAEKLRLRDHDVVYTTHFPIAGRIEGLVLKVRSTVFGEVQLQLAETRQVRSLAGGGEVEVTVDAGRYGAPTGDQWLETEVELEKGASLKVRAEGTINLNPQNGQNFQTGPNGNNQWGQPNGGPGPAGSLIGRIGRNGQQFLLGVRFDGEARDSGRLYLRVGPSPWGNFPAGNYTVTVTPELGLDAKVKGPEAPMPTKQRLPRVREEFKREEFKKEERKVEEKR